MRYLTMIVALVPGVAAFSRVHSKPLMKVSSGGSVSTSTVSTYRPRSIWPKTQRCVTDTRLHYISGADHEHTANKQASRSSSSSWWYSIFGGEQSSAADDYLEFLDRRYNRLLSEDGEDSKGFSVMDWLHQNSNNEAEVSTTKGREEDALYVLGVANLASKKFLQKHHLPSPEEPSKTRSPTQKAAIVTDAEIVESSFRPLPVATLAAVFHEVGRRREMMLRQQSKGFRVATACVIRSILTGPARAIQALQRLYAMGGGKKSFAMTVAALAALSFLLRPLIRVAAAEGANTMRP